MSVTTFSHIHRARPLGGFRYHHLNGTGGRLHPEPSEANGLGQNFLIRDRTPAARNFQRK
jgi:hypothetical protein